MATLTRLRAKMPSIISEWFDASRLAEARRDKETQAAVLIQSCARGFLTRRRLMHLGALVVKIQSCWRGYLGRLRAKLAREGRDKRLRQKFFDSQATVIERHWRGFWSRKTKFDYYARKKYLEEIRSKNEEVGAEMELEAQHALEAQRKMAEDTARKLFDQKVGKLHHLLSTSSQPGIFNSPHAMASGTLPLVLGSPVEDHLKASFKSQSTQLLPPIKKTLKKATGPLDIYSTEVVVDGNRVKAGLTLRQTVPYDAQRRAEVLEEKVHRSEMLSLHPVPFAHSIRSLHEPMLELQTNRNLEPYRDPFDPTLGTRNEVFSESMQAISATPFRKMQKQQPFFNPLMKESY